ncbi:alpha/beta hydrolase [Hahella aquimaris]|uniref:alpha/beta fold hydrolase n=1 Tax=Hahella sp. HNIBRBA332 TaxID=3015983 RepID=UPI00273C9278|nr:alpha/beta hydrolase [Hahella sp. HNIBRBA332]WLQ13523.1 alpha/beta hydrolase [Hahella sp. HNIBRBA332]
MERSYDYADIGDVSLRYLAEGSGNATVIFESDLGGGIDAWERVQPLISLFTRTLSYDRADLQDTDASLSCRSAENMVADLRKLLQVADIKPPYILVGHCAGAAHIRYFAHKYPNEVVGQVFVDGYDDAEAADNAESHNVLGATERGRSIPFLNNAPTSILVGDNPPETSAQTPEPTHRDRRQWIESHREWLRHMPQARFRVIANARRYLPLSHPDFVVEEINRVLADARRAL